MAQACGEELVEEEREHALAAEVELLARGRDHRLGPVAVNELPSQYARLTRWKPAKVGLTAAFPSSRPE